MVDWQRLVAMARPPRQQHRRLPPSPARQRRSIVIGDQVANQSPKGMRLQFACTYGRWVPASLGFTGRETGWELRRKIKAYCKARNLVDYKIIRNTSYVRALHGPAVYELYVTTQPTEV
jgi:hypothetical protein